MVKYTAPESSKIAIEDIQPTGWGDSFEYHSQPEEVYQPCQFSQQSEITEDFSSNASAKVYNPEDGYYHINAIFEDEGEDGLAVDSESVADNESLHPEDWEEHPENSEDCDSSYALQEVEEDRFNSTKKKG